MGDDPSRGWIIAINDWPHFDIGPADLRPGGAHSDESLNGLYPTKLAAVERVIADLETVRAELVAQIARAKAMRRRLLSDSDGSGEAGQTAKQAGPKATARCPKGNRPTLTSAPQ